MYTPYKVQKLHYNDENMIAFSQFSRKYNKISNIKNKKSIKQPKVENDYDSKSEYSDLAVEYNSSLKTDILKW